MEHTNNNGQVVNSPKGNDIPDYAQAVYKEYEAEKITPDGILAEADKLQAEVESAIPEPYKKIRELVQKCRINANDDIQPPDYILYIGEAPVMSLENFSLFIGKAKSRKTFAMTLIMATFLVKVIQQLKTEYYGNKVRLCWFDTEQSKYYVQRAYRTALHLAGITDAPQLEVYHLRSLSPQERQGVIDQVLYIDNVNNDVLFAIIDGIRDLITSINDEEQATEIATWLMKVTEEKGLHIATVLHQNKGDNNARGHIGTELINKAQSVISIERSPNNKDVSIVKMDYAKDKEFEPFAFTISEGGLPEIDNDFECESKTKERTKNNPFDYELKVHRMAANEIFAKEDELNPTILRTQIKLWFAKNYFSFGDNRAREFLKHWENEDIIKRTGKTKDAKYKLDSC